MSSKQKILFVAIIVLALFFRVFNLARLPGGLFPDEAANGLDINLMQQGQLQPFYERGNGREALFFYMLWGSVELFGKGHWQHHLVSGLVGVLAVLACFLVTRRLLLAGPSSANTPEQPNQSLSPNQDRLEPNSSRAVNIALLASFLMAVSTWHIVLSRTAFRANLIPLFAALTFYFLLKTYQEVNRSKKYFHAFWAGLVFALGFYSYIAYRILVPITAALVIWPWLALGFVEGIKRWWKHFLIFMFAFLIFFWPLAKYFYTHPGSFVGRSGQVSIFNPDLNQGDLIGVAGEVLRLSLKAYFTAGDLNWRHNISGFAFLSPLVSPFFGAALVVITVLAAGYVLSPKKRSEHWKYAALAAWFWGMLLPVVTTAEGIPHGLRAIGTIPPVFIISALGLYWFAENVIKLHKKLHEHWPKGMGLVRAAFKLCAGAFFAALILQTFFAYFVYAANSAENYYAFRSDLTAVSKYLKERCNKAHTFLVLDKFSVQTTDYTTSDWHGNFSDPCNVPYKQVDPENAWELKDLSAGDEIVFTQSSIYDIKKFKEFHPSAELKMEVRNKFGQAVMAVYEIQN